jgi:hypothetical protein
MPLLLALQQSNGSYTSFINKPGDSERRGVAMLSAEMPMALDSFSGHTVNHFAWLFV